MSSDFPSYTPPPPPPLPDPPYSPPYVPPAESPYAAPYTPPPEPPSPPPAAPPTPDTSNWPTFWDDDVTVVYEYRTDTAASEPPSITAPSTSEAPQPSASDATNQQTTFTTPEPTSTQSGTGPAPTTGDQSISSLEGSGSKGDPQMWLSESGAFDFSVIATRAGRGFTRAHRAFARRVVELFGGPEKYDLVHKDKPFVNLKQGEASKAGIGDRSANRRQGAAERAAGGVRSGNKGVDPNAIPGKKNVQPKPPELKPISNKPITAGAGSAARDALRQLAGRAGLLLGIPGYVNAVRTLANDFEMHNNPGSPSLGPISTHRRDSVGTEWVKVGPSEWVTKAYLDKST